MQVNNQITRQAWESSPLAILTLDSQGVVRFVNPAGTKIFARDEGAMIGCRIADLTHPLDRLALSKMLEFARAGGIPGRQEVRFVRSNMADVTTGVSVAPGDVGSSYTVCVIRDLSSEKVLRPQLLHTERMASMGLVASVIAHELNNALAGAIGCLELLQSALKGRESDLLDTALQELNRSAEIVGDIKGYARIEEGMSDRFSVSELVGSFQRLHRYHVEADGLPIQVCERSAELPDLEGNKNQLLQALLNLVRNAEDAVKEMPASRQQINIEIELNNDVVCFSVIDRGPGVTEELRARLFDPFYSTKPLGAGTGLGLTVVQSVAAGHGGRIEVLETHGGGATFQLLLPVPADALPVIAEERAADDPVNLSALEGASILAADDEPSIRRMLQRIGVSLGAEMVVVDSASSAIDALQQRDFDLVLLDVRMPGGGGPAVFQFIMKDASHLIRRTIFMTGEPSLELGSIRGTGYFGILAKPFRISELNEILAKALSSAAD